MKLKTNLKWVWWNCWHEVMPMADFLNTSKGKRIVTDSDIADLISRVPGVAFYELEQLRDNTFEIRFTRANKAMPWGVLEHYVEGLISRLAPGLMIRVKERAQ